MKTDPRESFSKATPTSRFGILFQNPLLRILVAFAFMLPVFIISKGIKSTVFPIISDDILVIIRYFEALLCFGLFLWMYTLYAGFIEKRTPLEITLHGSLRDLGRGFLISFLVVSVVVLVLIITRCLIISGLIRNTRLVVDLFVKFFMGAFIEELLFRLILFKLTEEFFGTWIALIVQALLFGFAHLFNDNATIFTSMAVAIVGGLVYISAFILSRSIWFPLGLHWSWNFAQSGIFSMPNSGTPYDGFFITTVSGPAWLTGGSFGIEASYLTILIWIFVSIVFIRYATRRSQIVLPRWKRKP